MKLKYFMAVKKPWKLFLRFLNICFVWSSEIAEEICCKMIMLFDQIFIVNILVKIEATIKFI